MARTRQTARRVIGGSRQQGEPSFVYDPVQSELFCKLLKANCKELSSSEKPTSLQSRLAQYNNCTKLAQLWILEDMKKSERDIDDQTIVDAEWLKQLPSELKVEIISFIPTTTKQPSMYFILQYYRVGGGDLTNVPLVEYTDAWFISFMKYRALSKTFKSAMEHLIFKTLSNKGLDITGFISRGFTSIERRVWFVSSLIESHNRFIQGAWNGDFQLSEGFQLERNEPSIHDFGSSFAFTASEPSSTSSNDHFINNIDLSSVDLNSVRSIEEELLSKNEFTNETPFDSVPYCKESEMVDLVDSQSLKMLMLCNKLDHIDMTFPNGPTKDCKNETIKSLSISLLDCSMVHKVFELLPNIEDLTIILYNSMEWYQALDSLQLKSRENLKSLNIIAMDNMIWTDMVRLLPTSITTIFTFLQDGPLLQYGNLEMYLDGKLIPQIDDNTDYIDPAQKLCFKSCDFSFFLQIANKYTLLPFLSDSFFSRVGKFTSLEDLKCFTNFISKNYPIEGEYLLFQYSLNISRLFIRKYFN